MDLKNKTILLIGGSSGIGKEIAKAMIGKGAKFIVCGLHKPTYSCDFFKVDVRNENEVIAVVEKLRSFDVLIYNAGIAKIHTLEKSPLESFDEQFSINVRGLFLFAKYACKKINSNGCIVTISSLAGLHSFEEYGIYCATKSAVISLTKTLAIELADKKIRANSLAPGIIDTDLWLKMYGKGGKKVLKESERYTLVKRSGKPEEIAHAAIFLCENDFINGETILIDGGELSR